MTATSRLAYVAAAAGLFLLLPSDAGAQNGPGGLVTDRPDQTESSAVVPPGFAQLEVGWTHAGDGEGIGRVRSHTLPGALVRIGVTSNLEARLGFSGWTRVEIGDGNQTMSSTGIGDTDIGVKFRAFDGTGVEPDIAFIATVSLPTGGDGFSDDRALPTLRAALAHELNDQVSVAYNVGVVWSVFEDAGSRTTSLADLLYTLAFGFQLNDQVGAFVESFGTVSVDDRTTSTHSLDAGFTFPVRDNLQFDVSGGVALNDAAEDWFLGAGVSVRVPR